MCVKLLSVKFVCVKFVCVKFVYVKLLYIKFVCVKLLSVKFVCVKFVCVWSYCLLSLCVWSLCVLSLCMLSLCVWNYCMLSLCVWSYCLLSLCVLSLCVLSFCVWNYCMWSLCVWNYCMLSLCVWSYCLLSLCVLSLCVWNYCMLSLCVLCYGGGGRRRRSPGYRIKNKNPTQRCGEKGSKRESAAKSKWKTRTGGKTHIKIIKPKFPKTKSTRCSHMLSLSTLCLSDGSMVERCGKIRCVTRYSRLQWSMSCVIKCFSETLDETQRFRQVLGVVRIRLEQTHHGDLDRCSKKKNKQKKKK